MWGIFILYTTMKIFSKFQNISKDVCRCCFFLFFHFSFSSCYPKLSTLYFVYKGDENSNSVVCSHLILWKYVELIKWCSLIFLSVVFVYLYEKSKQDLRHLMMYIFVMLWLFKIKCFERTQTKIIHKKKRVYFYVFS